MIYHYDCEDCQAAIPGYVSLSAQSPTPRVAFVAMPPLAPAGQDPVADSPDYVHLSLRPNQDWFATTPVVIALEDGRVLAEEEGEKAVGPMDVRRYFP